MVNQPANHKYTEQQWNLQKEHIISEIIIKRVIHGHIGYVAQPSKNWCLQVSGGTLNLYPFRWSSPICCLTPLPPATADSSPGPWAFRTLPWPEPECYWPVARCQLLWHCPHKLALPLGQPKYKDLLQRNQRIFASGSELLLSSNVGWSTLARSFYSFRITFEAIKTRNFAWGCYRFWGQANLEHRGYPKLLLASLFLQKILIGSNNLGFPMNCSIKMYQVINGEF